MIERLIRLLKTWQGNADQDLVIAKTTIRVGGTTFLLTRTHFDGRTKRLSLDFEDEAQYRAAHTVCRKCPDLHTMDTEHNR